MPFSKQFGLNLILKKFEKLNNARRGNKTYKEGI